jgi:hypothetical protein
MNEAAIKLIKKYDRWLAGRISKLNAGFLFMILKANV